MKSGVQNPKPAQVPPSSRLRAPHLNAMRPVRQQAGHPLTTIIGREHPKKTSRGLLTPPPLSLVGMLLTRGTFCLRALLFACGEMEADTTHTAPLTTGKHCWLNPVRGIRQVYHHRARVRSLVVSHAHDGTRSRVVSRASRSRASRSRVSRASRSQVSMCWCNDINTYQLNHWWNSFGGKPRWNKE